MSVSGTISLWPFFQTAPLFVSVFLLDSRNTGLNILRWESGSSIARPRLTSAYGLYRFFLPFVRYFSEVFLRYFFVVVVRHGIIFVWLSSFVFL